jgi:hypothetical protein
MSSDYVQDGEQLAIISDKQFLFSMNFLLNLKVLLTNNKLVELPMVKKLKVSWNPLPAVDSASQTVS